MHGQQQTTASSVGVGQLTEVSCLQHGHLVHLVQHSAVDAKRCDLRHQSQISAKLAGMLSFLLSREFWTSIRSSIAFKKAKTPKFGPGFM